MSRTGKYVEPKQKVDLWFSRTEDGRNKGMEWVWERGECEEMGMTASE